MTPAEHHRRVAGRANRERVLDAAEAVFGTRGAAGSTEEVAARAGVGIGTVFRHFPTKAQLLDAVLARRFARLADHAHALLDDDDDGDPAAALRAFFTHLVADAKGKIAIGEALLSVSDGRPSSEGERAVRRLKDAVGRLLARAQEAGAVRADVRRPEVYALMVGTARAVNRERLSGAARDRAISVVLDGLSADRPPGR